MSDSFVAENIRRIISSKGLKNGAVAARAGFSDKQFSALLCKRRIIRDVDVIAIANALEVTPNELFGYARPSVDNSQQFSEL